ncbi:hypothetical protein [Methanococcoides sp. FTZ1]|uniref:hypothetical protein n=1 Tax=Methanococcoides sp. FTZ1 TaxID=3439061 RepID=UPI003F848577
MKDNRKYGALILFSFLLISSTVIPVTGIQIKNTVLLDGAGIFIESGGSWEFSQGYVFVVKDVNEDGGAWVELSLDDILLKDAILYEGDYFVYSRGSSEIFNMTVDTVYYGSDDELITFKPVFQYLDPSLPAPELDNPDVSSNGSENPLVPDDTTDENIPGFSILIAISSVMLLFVCSRIFRNR